MGSVAHSVLSFGRCPKGAETHISLDLDLSSRVTGRGGSVHPDLVAGGPHENSPGAAWAFGHTRGFSVSERDECVVMCEFLQRLAGGIAQDRTAVPGQHVTRRRRGRGVLGLYRQRSQDVPGRGLFNSGDAFPQFFVQEGARPQTLDCPSQSVRRGWASLREEIQWKEPAAAPA